MSWPRALPWCSSRSLLVAPAAAEPVVSPLALDCAPWPADELALPLAEGAVEPLAEGEVEVLADGDVPPVALPDVLPVALPEPEDWLVCAPWFMVEDGLVVVALWLADVLLETF